MTIAAIAAAGLFFALGWYVGAHEDDLVTYDDDELDHWRQIVDRQRERR
jgi:hypothetical protein